MSNDDLREINSYIKDVLDYSEAGVVFKDITGFVAAYQVRTKAYDILVNQINVLMY